MLKIPGYFFFSQLQENDLYYNFIVINYDCRIFVRMTTVPIFSLLTFKKWELNKANKNIRRYSLKSSDGGNILLIRPFLASLILYYRLSSQLT